ncbi:MAG: hypothetical protein ACO1TE_06360 [Prosthecobacter sp.]
MKSSHFRRLVLPVLLLCALPSCGTEFRKAWNNAPGVKAATHPHICLPKPGHVEPVAGRWDGTWHSDASGHHGRLRCVVSHPKNAAGDREFFYHATWMGFLSGGYKATHHVQQQGPVHVFKGEHKMPDWAGGFYHYDGTISNGEFKANYKSSADHGTYTMKRVP